MTNLDSTLKSRDITLPTKVHLVKAMVFPVVMCGCESWNIKKVEQRRVDSFELCCWKRPWCWEILKVGGEGDDRGWDSWMASPTQWTWAWVSSGSWWWTGKPGVLQSMGLQSWTWQTTTTNLLKGTGSKWLWPSNRCFLHLKPVLFSLCSWWVNHVS